MEAYVIRHTSVAIENGICYGQTDVPLAATFANEVEVVRRKLPPFENVTVYSSPLRRCCELAKVLAHKQLIRDARLMEMSFGEWEEQRWDDLQGPRFTHWTQNFVSQRCAGGESYQEVFRRVADFWEELIQIEVQNVVIVTHGGVIRALLAHWLDVPLRHTLRIETDFGGVTKVRQTTYGPVVEYVNR